MPATLTEAQRRLLRDMHRTGEPTGTDVTTGQTMAALERRGLVRIIPSRRIVLIRWELTDAGRVVAGGL